MAQPLAHSTISSGHEPLRRQCHDKYSSSTDHSADYHHAVRRKLLRQRAYDRHQANDNDRVDCGKLSDRRVKAQFANAELRKNVIHLQKDRFQKSDEEEENKQPVEAGLTDQPPEKITCVDGTLPHRLADAAPKRRLTLPRFDPHLALRVRLSLPGRGLR